MKQGVGGKRQTCGMEAGFGIAQNGLDLKAKNGSDAWQHHPSLAQIYLMEGNSSVPGPWHTKWPSLRIAHQILVYSSKYIHYSSEIRSKNCLRVPDKTSGNDSTFRKTT